MGSLGIKTVMMIIKINSLLVLYLPSLIKELYTDFISLIGLYISHPSSPVYEIRTARLSTPAI